MFLITAFVRSLGTVPIPVFATWTTKQESALTHEKNVGEEMGRWGEVGRRGRGGSETEVVP